MQLFFNETLDKDTIELTFNKTESKHIIKVLRKKEGDRLYITNGKNYLFTGKILAANVRECRVQIIKSNYKKPKRSYQIQIAIAPTKRIERFQWFLEKAVEIGIDAIYPIICTHSERKVLRIERLKKVMETAMTQSLQYQLPKLNKPLKFSEFLKQDFNGQTFVAHCHKTDKKKFKQELQPKMDVRVLIGPEGDFSFDEIQLALQNKYIPVSLGNTRLRTETAGIAAVHTIALVNEK